MLELGLRLGQGLQRPEKGLECRDLPKHMIIGLLAHLIYMVTDTSLCCHGNDLIPRPLTYNALFTLNSGLRRPTAKLLHSYYSRHELHRVRLSVRPLA